MNISAETATLIAALIAAISSLLSLFFGARSEVRSANRRTLETVIFDLSQSIHELIATSNIILKNKSDKSRDSWKDRANEAKNKLKDIRPKVRYALWGIEKPIRALTRLPDFTVYTLLDSDTAKKVVKNGSKLGDAIDWCIRNCYLHGRAPRFYEIWYIKYREWRFVKVRNDYKKDKIVAQ